MEMEEKTGANCAGWRALHHIDGWHNIVNKSDGEPIIADASPYWEGQWKQEIEVIFDTRRPTYEEEGIEWLMPRDV
jgi:hypothetical protein